MKAIQKKCEKLENKKKKWKQEVVNLNKLLEMNVVEFGEVEQYKRKIEERARQDVVEKLKEVNLFLQVNLLILMCFNSFHCKLHCMYFPTSLNSSLFCRFLEEGGFCFSFQYLHFHHYNQINLSEGFY